MALKAELSSDRNTEQRNAPMLASFARINLTSGDIEQSRRFYADVLCGEQVQVGDGYRFRFDNFEIAIAPGPGAGTPPGAEYPHYAFTVTPEQFVEIKRRLDAFKIPTNEPWTRSGKPYALMYFRDPSGNQFELFAPEGCAALSLRIGAKAGGDYRTDFNALDYDAVGTPERPVSPASTSGINHITVPVRDLAEGKKFLVSVLKGRVVHDAPKHVTARIAGTDFGVAPQPVGATAPEALYPHHTFCIEPGELAAMKAHVESFAIPTHGIASSDGVDAFFFFRDPSGNLLQVMCPRGFRGEKFLVPKNHPTLGMDLQSLCYDQWKIPVD